MGGLLQQGGVVACGVDGAESGDVGDAEAAGDLLGRADEECADLAGGVDVGSATCVAVVVFDFDDAEVSFSLG